MHVMVNYLIANVSHSPSLAQYSFDGYLWQVYSTQDFEVPGMNGYEISGKSLLDDIYGLTNVNSWGMFGVMIAWICLFRLTHYGLFYYDVRPYLSAPNKKA